MQVDHDITRLLHAWSQGDKASLNALIPVVHAELHRLAEGYLRRERPGHTLQATALIHEAYMRLVNQRQDLRNRNHFYGVAAHLMRLILTDHARTRLAQKRGAGIEEMPLESVRNEGKSDRLEDLLALEEALDELNRVDERRCRILEMRFFGGMTPGETAEVLGVSEPTIHREMRLARAWLLRRLAASPVAR
jgi:RNA polymerase sigma factor (TIGR02999 family)